MVAIDVPPAVTPPDPALDSAGEPDASPDEELVLRRAGAGGDGLLLLAVGMPDPRLGPLALAVRAELVVARVDQLVAEPVTGART